MSRVQIRPKELNKLIEKYNLTFSKKDKVELLDKKVYFVNGTPSFFYYEDKLIPTLKTLLEHSNILNQITIDMGAIKFVIKGADIMRPGITKVGEGIENGEVILIVDETHGKPIALGQALFSSEEILSKDSGKVVKNIHYVGDDFWKLS